MEMQVTQVSDVMTRGVRTLTPRDTLVQAARAMDELDVGAIAVCEGERLIGLVTDRDIVVRGIAEGGDVANMPLGDVMSGDPRWCCDDQDVDEALAQMRGLRVRRIPVLDQAQHQHLVGTLSLGDVAVKAGSNGGGVVLEQVSEPAPPDRSFDGAQAASNERAGEDGGDAATGSTHPGPMANEGTTTGRGVVSGGDGGVLGGQDAFTDERAGSSHDMDRAT
jgi:CBS domain-containing protein